MNRMPEFTFTTRRYIESTVKGFDYLERTESLLMFEDQLQHQVLLESDTIDAPIAQSALLYPVSEEQKEDLDFVLTGLGGCRGRFRESDDPYISNGRCSFYSRKHDFFFAGEGSLYQPEAELMAALWEILGFSLVASRIRGVPTTFYDRRKFNDSDHPPEFTRPTSESQYLGVQFVWPALKKHLEEKLHRGCSPDDLCKTALAGYIWSDEIENASLKKLEQEEYDQIWDTFPEVLDVMNKEDVWSKNFCANSDLIQWGMLNNFYHWFLKHEPRVLAEPLWNKALDIAVADLNWYRH